MHKKSVTKNFISYDNTSSSNETKPCKNIPLESAKKYNKQFYLYYPLNYNEQQLKYEIFNHNNEPKATRTWMLHLFTCR